MPNVRIDKTKLEYLLKLYGYTRKELQEDLNEKNYDYFRKSIANESISLNLLEKIADFFDCSPQYLMGQSPRISDHYSTLTEGEKKEIIRISGFKSTEVDDEGYIISNHDHADEHNEYLDTLDLFKAFLEKSSSALTITTDRDNSFTISDYFRCKDYIEPVAHIETYGADYHYEELMHLVWNKVLEEMDATARKYAEYVSLMKSGAYKRFLSDDTKENG